MKFAEQPITDLVRRDTQPREGADRHAVRALEQP
jgi:hypothetical protein